MTSFKRNSIPAIYSINEKVDLFKNKGSYLFRNKFITKAIMKYLECLALFKDDKSLHAIEKQSLINSNIALCYLKLSNYTESLYYAEKALLLDGSNIKSQ